jgi:hypothetical protein
MQQQQQQQQHMHTKTHNHLVETVLGHFIVLVSQASQQRMTMMNDGLRKRTQQQQHHQYAIEKIHIDSSYNNTMHYTHRNGEGDGEEGGMDVGGMIFETASRIDKHTLGRLSCFIESLLRPVMNPPWSDIYYCGDHTCYNPRSPGCINDDDNTNNNVTESSSSLSSSSRHNLFQYKGNARTWLR